MIRDFDRDSYVCPLDDDVDDGLPSTHFPLAIVNDGTRRAR